MSYKIIGRLFLHLYRCKIRLKAKIFSSLAGGGFAAFGKKSVLMPPIRLAGEERIEIGSGVYVGEGCWLQSLPDKGALPNEGGKPIAISIGDGTSMAGSCIISAVHRITIENDVLIARNVYISDHIHKYTDISQPISKQGLDKVAPVKIRRGAWIGENAVLCPGVTIGIGSIVGANSVVKEDVPDYTIAAGAPSHIIKKITPDDH